MTVAILLALSLAWGGLLVIIGAALQRLGLSGAMRQWMWRVAAFLLIAPFAAAGVFQLLGPDVVEPFWTWGEGGMAQVPIVIDPARLNAVATPTASTEAPFFPYELSPTEMVLMLMGLGWFVRAVIARRAAKELECVTRTAEPARSQAVLAAASRWSERLKLMRQPQVMLMSGDFSPFTQGVLRPVVYLPHGLEAKLTPGEMDLVIGHELMHVKRCDAMWRPLERLVADLLWFNPFAWFVRCQLERARELACDEAMLKRKAPAKDYARALVTVARFAAGLPYQAPAAAMFPFNKDKALPERVKAAAAGAGRSSRTALAGLAAFVLAGIPLAVAQGAGAPKQRLPIPEFETTIVASDKARITSAYGERIHPKSGKQALHSGVDVGAASGTPILAPADAEVVAVDYSDGYGNYVKLRFNKEWMGRFSNMSKAKVVTGQRVRAGDVIGLIGNSGKNSTGPHLHFEIWGPAADFDRTGQMVAFDPLQLGVAPTPSQALNAEQIRKLGIVLPDQLPGDPAPPVFTAVEPPALPRAKVADTAPPIPPGTPKRVEIDVARLEALEQELDGDFDIEMIDDAGNIEFSDAEGRRFVFIDHAEGAAKQRAAMQDDAFWSEADLEEIRREARELAREVQEAVREANEVAREAAREARDEAREAAAEAREASREMARALREAERERALRRLESERHDPSLELDGGPDIEWIEEIKLEALDGLDQMITEGVELGLREAGLAIQGSLGHGALEIQIEALSDAIDEIHQEIVELDAECNDDELKASGFEGWVEEMAMKQAVSALKTSRKSLIKQRDALQRRLDS